MVRFCADGAVGSDNFRATADEASALAEKMLFTSAARGKVVLDLLPEHKSSLGQDIMDMLKAMNAELRRTRADTLLAAEEVKQIVAGRFPELELMTFGSQATGLALPGAERQIVSYTTVKRPWRETEPPTACISSCVSQFSP